MGAHHRRSQRPAGPNFRRSEAGELGLAEEAAEQFRHWRRAGHDQALVIWRSEDTPNVSTVRSYPRCRERTEVDR